MEWLVRALSDLTRWQIAVLVLVVFLSFGATYSVYDTISSSDQHDLEDNQRLIPVHFGNLVNEVAINGSVAFSNKETLTFGSSGTVAELLVSDGQEVEQGQPLATLDPETVANLRQAVAQARLDLLNAEVLLADARDPVFLVAEASFAVAEASLALDEAKDALDDLVNPKAQAVSQAEAAASDASLALQQAQDDLDTLLDPDPRAIAEAKRLVLEADISVTGAEKAMGSEVVAAVTDVDAAAKELESARKDLELAPNENDVRVAREDYEDARQDYLDVHKKWTGVVLTEDELLQPPETLFEAWDFDPEVIYDPKYDLLPDGVLANNPDTRWNELTIYGWVRLYPGVSSIEVTCAGKVESSTSNTNSRISQQELCIQRDFDNAWEEFKTATISLDTLQTQADRGTINAQASIIRAEETLVDAQDALAELTDGLGLDLLEKELLVARTTLADVKADLEELVEPDLTDVRNKRDHASLAQANLDDANTLLTELLEPAPLEVQIRRKQVALAQVVLDKAKLDQGALAQSYPLEVALQESAVANAEAALEGAIRRFDDSTLTSPWSGFISLVHVQEREEVNATTPILEVIDPTIAVIDGIVDEIDVLSVRPGTQASVTMDALPNQVLSGKVLDVGSSATNQQGVVTFDVEIEIAVPDGVRLQEGLSAVADVVLSVESGILIPSQAVSGTFDDPRVLVENGGALEPRAVVLGGSDGFWTVVVSGLSDGDQIVIEVQDTQAQQVGFRGIGGGGGFRGR